MLVRDLKAMKRDEINQDQDQDQESDNNNNKGHHRSSSSSSSSSDRGRISDLSYLYEVLGKSSFDEMVTTLSRFNQSSSSSSSSSSSNHLVNKTPPTLSSSFIQYNGFPPSLNFHQLSHTQDPQEQDDSSSKPTKPRSRSRRSSMSGYTNLFIQFICLSGYTNLLFNLLFNIF